MVSTYSGEVFIHFERLRQPWLKEAAKRWARARLLGDTTPQTMSPYLTDLWHFSDWLAAHAPEVALPALLSREVLEDYLVVGASGVGLEAGDAQPPRSCVAGAARGAS